jgi:hypothetical protein
VSQQIGRKRITYEDAEIVAREIATIEPMIRALIIISNDGKVLAHARRPHSEADEEDPSDVPDLMNFPDQDVSIFVKRQQRSDPRYLYKRLSKAMDAALQLSP